MASIKVKEPQLTPARFLGHPCRVCRTRTRYSCNSTCVRCNQRNKEKHIHKFRAYHKRQWGQLVRDVIKKYGGKCKCCGETIAMFLTIDHIEGHGTGHRERRSLSKTMYRMLRAEPRRKDLRLLCWNCNSGRARNGGICPHKDKRVS